MWNHINFSDLIEVLVFECSCKFDVLVVMDYISTAQIKLFKKWKPGAFSNNLNFHSNEQMENFASFVGMKTVINL